MLYTTEIMDMLISKQSSKFIMEISGDVSFFMILHGNSIKIKSQTRRVFLYVKFNS